MDRRPDRFIATALAIVVAGSLAALAGGCAPSQDGTATPGTGSTVAATSTATGATSAVEATPATQATPTVEPTVTAPPKTAKGLPYKPGPNETGRNFAYLKKAYLDHGYVYIVVDYVIIGEGGDGWFIKNDNPKLRTFPLKKTCPCRYLVEGGASLSGPKSPTTFLAKWKAASSSKMIRHNPYAVTVKNGVVTKLDNEWLP